MMLRFDKRDKQITEKIGPSKHKIKCVKSRNRSNYVEIVYWKCKTPDCSYILYTLFRNSVV